MHFILNRCAKSPSTRNSLLPPHIPNRTVILGASKKSLFVCRMFSLLSLLIWHKTHGTWNSLSRERRLRCLITRLPFWLSSVDSTWNFRSDERSPKGFPYRKQRHNLIMTLMYLLFHTFSVLMVIILLYQTCKFNTYNNLNTIKCKK